MSKHTFGKSDRLKSKQQIEKLFVDGNSFTEFPLKVIWRLIETTNPSIQVAFSVPKNKLPKAVHRNHMKRLLRESYRQQNQALKSMVFENGKQLHVMLVFFDTELWDFIDLDNKISVTLERLQKKL